MPIICFVIFNFRNSGRVLFKANCFFESWWHSSQKIAFRSFLSFTLIINVRPTCCLQACLLFIVSFIYRKLWFHFSFFSVLQKSSMITVKINTIGRLGIQVFADVSMIVEFAVAVYFAWDAWRKEQRHGLKDVTPLVVTMLSVGSCISFLVQFVSAHTQTDQISNVNMELVRQTKLRKEKQTNNFFTHPVLLKTDGGETTCSDCFCTTFCTPCAECQNVSTREWFPQRWFSEKPIHLQTDSHSSLTSFPKKSGSWN